MKIIKNIGGIELWLLILVALGSLVFVGGFSPGKKNTNLPDTSLVAQDIPATSSGKSLQLKTIPFITVAPTLMPTSPPQPPPAPEPTIEACPFDDGGVITDPSCSCPGYKVTCKDKKCVDVIPGGGNSFMGPVGCDWGPGRTTYDGWCAKPNLAPTDGMFCLAKPVIYLYPTKITNVNVKITVPGQIVKSDPLYENGWQNVEAHPDGSLIYKGKNYHELFYETSVSKINPPKTGFVVSANNVEQTLKDMTTRLGLIESEQKEFLDYWLPALKNLNSPYLLISLLDVSEKDRVDHVDINPAPDTKIEFLFYFKPEKSQIEINKLKLPAPPKRIGFTSVEWGGTIDLSEFKGGNNF